MKAPVFVRVINDIWCLAGDNAITVEIERAGKLAWDQSFAKVITALQRREPGLVLDVGAYIGDSTRWFTESGFSTVAFEVQRDAFLCLAHNCPEATVINYPAGNGERVGVATQEAGNLGARALIPVDSGGLHTLRIDDLCFERVALIKIDVEGWEPEVLAGAAKTIARDQPLIVAEINPVALAARGATPDDIYKHLQGWSREEIFRYYEENWDLLFTHP